MRGARGVRACVYVCACGVCGNGGFLIQAFIRILFEPWPKPKGRYPPYTAPDYPIHRVMGQLAWPTKRVAPTAVTHGEVDGQDGQRWGLLSIRSDTAPGESFCTIHIHKYTYILHTHAHTHRPTHTQIYLHIAYIYTQVPTHAYT